MGTRGVSVGEKTKGIQMTSIEEQTQLRIYKRGFRHSPVDRKFIESSINWLYCLNTIILAKLSRTLMGYVVSQTLSTKLPRVHDLPYTEIQHDWNIVTKKNTVFEKMYVKDLIQISLVEITKLEQDEIDNSDPKGYDTTLTYLNKYLEQIATDEVGARLANDVSFSDFIIKLRDLIKDNEPYIFPLLMSYDVSDDKHAFSITLVPRVGAEDFKSKVTHCLKIDVKII